MGEVARKVDREASTNWLMRSVGRMVRPIVGFTVGRVSCSALLDLVREIYIDEARKYLGDHSGGKVTYSALSLISGLDGRAIKAVEQNSGRDYEPSDVCSEAAILEMWYRDESFKDPETGEPAELLVHGPGRTFQRLVHRAAGRAITSHTVLDRFVSSGNVEVDADGAVVRLLDWRYTPIDPSDLSAIESGSFAINRLGHSILHNSRHTPARGERWLQQDRWSTDIPAHAVPQIRAELRELISHHISQVEDFLENREVQSNDVEASVGVGWYYWEEAPQPQDSSDDTRL